MFAINTPQYQKERKTMIIVAIYVDLLRSRYHVQMGALHPLANEFLSASFSRNGGP